MSKADKYRDMQRNTEAVPHESNPALQQLLDTSTTEVHGTGTPSTDTKQVDEGSTPDTNTGQEQGVRESHTDTENVDGGSVQDTFDIAATIRQYEQEKKQKKSYDDLYTKHTFVVRKDLLARLEKVAKKHSRGFKTKFINDLLEVGLNQLEKR